MLISEFLEKYGTHDPRMYAVKYDIVSHILSMKLENVEWMQIEYEKEKRNFTSLDITFTGVKNLNVAYFKQTNSRSAYKKGEAKLLEKLDEYIMDITLDGGNTVTIFTDEDISNTEKAYTAIKFVSEGVTVNEVFDITERRRILNG
jgi:hypothetical protein